MPKLTTDVGISGDTEPSIACALAARDHVSLEACDSVEFGCCLGSLYRVGRKVAAPVQRPPPTPLPPPPAAKPSGSGGRKGGLASFKELIAQANAAENAVKNAVDSRVATSSQSCTMWVDRHVHRTAGTSVRVHMMQLMELDALQRPQTWIIGPKAWTLLLDGLATLVAPCSPALADIRIGIEAHEAVEPWYDLFIQKLRAYRSRRDTCCRIVLSTRVRAPIDHYLSFFRWGIEKRYPGKTLDWWAPHNLQSTLLLRGNAGMDGQWIDGRKYEGRRRWYESFDASDFARLTDMLDHDFDVVYPTERFEDGFELIMRALALPQLLQNGLHRLNSNRSAHISAEYGHEYAGSPLAPSDRARLCSSKRSKLANEDMCDEVVRERAPLDAKLHAYAVERFRKDWERYQHVLLPRGDVDRGVPARPCRTKSPSASAHGRLCGFPNLFWDDPQVASLANTLSSALGSGRLRYMP